MFAEAHAGKAVSVFKPGIFDNADLIQDILAGMGIQKWGIVLETGHPNGFGSNRKLLVKRLPEKAAAEKKGGKVDFHSQVIMTTRS